MQGALGRHTGSESQLARTWGLTASLRFRFLICKVEIMQGNCVGDRTPRKADALWDYPCVGGVLGAMGPPAGIRG